jgi:hemerythrin
MNQPPTPLLWNDSFATGVTEIDEQHMILVHTLNEATTKLAHTASKELLEQITQDLLSYALYHFDTEEELMREYGYQAADDAMKQHLAQHRSFSAQVVSARDNLRAGAEVSADALLDFLKTWLVNHILKTDRQLGEFIVAKRSKKDEPDAHQ